MQAQILTPVKWAFSVKELPNDEAELLLTATVDKTWHLYSQKMPETAIELPLVFEFAKSSKYKKIGAVKEPVGVKKYDEDAKADIKSFVGKAVFVQRIKKLSKEPFKITGNLDGQACREGTCVGTKMDFSFSISGAKGEIDAKEAKEAEKATDSTAAVTINEKKDTTKENKNESISKSEDKSKEIDNMGLWSFFLFALGGGLIALLTPCIYPMIPMTVSFFMHSSEKKSKSYLSVLVYGLSIIIIYILVGTVVAVTLGPSFSNWLSTHWIPNLFFFVIFLIFAASFFGMFELTLPSWMINKSDQKADKGGFVGAFFMAFTLVLVSFSCTAPIVGMILSLSLKGEIIKPIIGMLGFSLAFAIPFSLFAFFPSALKKLPKSGGWLNTVKVVLGFIELALALKFLSIADQTYLWGILNRDTYIALWIVIFSLMGFYLLGKLKFSHDSETKHVSVINLILAIITFSFVVYLIPGMIGAPLKPLAGWLPPMESHSFDLNKIIRENSNEANKSLCEEPKYSDKLHLPLGLTGYFDLDQAMKCSKDQNKPLFVDFTGHGCVNCREMENRVWSDKKVLKRLKEDFIVVALYVDNKVINLDEKDQYANAEGKKITLLSDKNNEIQTSQFKTNSQPYYVILDGDRKQMGESKTYDLNVENFIKFLEDGKAEFAKAHPAK